MKEDLKWWTNHLKESNGKNIVQLIDQKSIIIQTDASKLGWGGGSLSRSKNRRNLVRERESASYKYSRTPCNNTCSEIILKQKTNQVVLIQTDNKTAMTYVNKMGGTVSSLCNQLALDL